MLCLYWITDKSRGGEYRGRGRGSYRGRGRGGSGGGDSGGM